MADGKRLEAAKSAGNDQPKVMKKVEKDRIKTLPTEVWEKYICPYCGYLLDEAVQCACGHRLCRSCAVDMFDK